MPTTKNESLVYTCLMCFVMVLGMSIYNIALGKGELSTEVILAAWMGLPMGYAVAFCLDRFIVGKPAKWLAFNKLLPKDASLPRKIITISTCMVVPMVLLMSGYEAAVTALQLGNWGNFGRMWLRNIPLNFIMARPLQMLIAGPLVRFAFSYIYAKNEG